MNSRLTLLGAVLAIQLVLIGVFFLQTDARQAEQTLWLDLGSAGVDRLVVSGEEGEVTLARSDGQWQVGELPADEEKVAGLITKLVDMQAPWPVATSGASQERFEVEVENHQRRLQLFAGGEAIADLFLGTSPGFQRVHARQAGEDEIFSIELSNYELPLNVEGWMDKALLSISDPVDRVQVTLNEGPTHDLKQSDEGWLYNDAAADQAAAATYVNRFKTLRVLSVADPELINEAQQRASIDVDVDDATKTLYIDQAGEEYLLRDAERSYKVATYIAEQLLLSDVELAAQADAGDESVDAASSTTIQESAPQAEE